MNNNITILTNGKPHDPSDAACRLFSAICSNFSYSAYLDTVNGIDTVMRDAHRSIRQYDSVCSERVSLDDLKPGDNRWIEQALRNRIDD